MHFLPRLLWLLSMALRCPYPGSPIGRIGHNGQLLGPRMCHHQSMSCLYPFIPMLKSQVDRQGAPECLQQGLPCFHCSAIGRRQLRLFFAFWLSHCRRLPVACQEHQVHLVAPDVLMSEDASRPASSSDILPIQFYWPFFGSQERPCLWATEFGTALYSRLHIRSDLPLD